MARELWRVLGTSRCVFGCGEFLAAFKIILGFGWEAIGQGDVAGGLEAGDVGAVLVFNAEKSPHSSSVDFGESDEEGADGIVLEIVRVDCVEDPVESENRVESHREVVGPVGLVATDVTEETLVGVGLQE